MQLTIPLILLELNYSVQLLEIIIFFVIKHAMEEQTLINVGNTIYELM